MNRQPIAEVRLYDTGEGDPYCTDHGFAYYEPMSTGHKSGLCSLDSNGAPLLRYIEGVGLVCREFVDWQDTLTADYTFTGNGSWEERAPIAGDRHKRLMQYSAAADTRWYATSNFELPANPQIAITVAMAETPPDNDGAGYPPYARVEFGRDTDGKYAIDIWPGTGVRLMHKPDASAWAVLTELPDNQPEPGSERVFLVRCARGRIAVSCDGGKEWTVYTDPSGAVTVPRGTVCFCGEAIAAAFGLHRLKYYEGVFTGARRQTFETRNLPEATLTRDDLLPDGTAIALADNSEPGSAVAGYTATLTPYEETAKPWNHFRSPELYSVAYQYPVVATTPSRSYTTPWAGMVVGVEVDKPLDLSESTCTVTIRRDPRIPWAGNLRNRRIEVLLGYKYDNGTTEMLRVFTGHVSRVSLVYDSFGAIAIQLKLVNLADWLKRAEWTPITSMPLGGQALNAANDAILLSEGLGSAYRSWHSKGDTFPLPLGTPEDRFEWPPAGERKWETLTRVNGYAGLEVAVTDDGILSTGPMGYVAAAVSRSLTASDVAAPEETLLEITNTADYGESATAIYASGSGGNGGGIASTAFDTAAERDPTSPRFCGRRYPVQETVGGTATPGILAARAGALAGELFPVKQEPDFTVSVDLARQRRDRVDFYGCSGIGIADGAQAVVLSLRHTFRLDPERGDADLSTHAGVRLL
jgi:hypothetical protein